MKKILFFLACTLFISCSQFEEHHDIKKVFRKYLEESLNNPDSLEEVSWSIERQWVFDSKDSLDSNSPLYIDYDATQKLTDEFGEIYLIRLIYRSENQYGALVKSELYAIYRELDKYIQFENYGYSYELNSFIDVKAGIMNPKRKFLSNRYYLLNQGKVNFDDFRSEYPEFY